MRLPLASCVGLVSSVGQPRVERHHHRNRQTGQVPPVDEEQRVGVGPEQKMNGIISHQLQLTTDILGSDGDVVREDVVLAHIVNKAAKAADEADKHLIN